MPVISPISSSCRLTARTVARQLQSHAQARAFRASRKCLVAQNFSMPALSPTMTEGNISKWMVKEGDSFSAGDILLQVETDKAEMDVEAQEDGIVAKIMQPDGSSAVKVGTRIAVLAEVGDDISTLEIPPEVKSTSTSSESALQSQQSTSDKAPSPDTSASSSSSSSSSHLAEHVATDRPMYPSVQMLLHEHNLSASDITPTGPGNRLLKGDVLAHLGSIPQSYPSELASRISKLSHLDLSNIKVAAPRQGKDVGKKPQDDAAATMTQDQLPPQLYEISLLVSLAPLLRLQTRLQDLLGSTPPLSTLLARAIALANDGLPAVPPPGPSADELFDSIVDASSSRRRRGPRVSKGHYEPIVGGLQSESLAAVGPKMMRKRDPFDDIVPSHGSAGSRTTKSSRNLEPVTESSLAAENVFSLVVAREERKRARVFLERLKSVVEVEPGRLVL